MLRGSKFFIKGKRYIHASLVQEEHALAFVNIKPPELQLPASLALTCRCSWRENVRWSRKISCDQWPAPAALAELNSPSEEAFLFCRIWHLPLSTICVGVTASMFICAWQLFTSSAATTFVFYNICQLYNITALSALTVGFEGNDERCSPALRVCKKIKSICHHLALKWKFNSSLRKVKWNLEESDLFEFEITRCASLTSSTSH